MTAIPGGSSPEMNLAWAVSQAQALGWRVETATPHFVTLVSGERRRTNHILHLLLTLATCGLWAIVWIVIAIVNSDPANAVARMTVIVDEAGRVTYNR